MPNLDNHIINENENVNLNVNINTTPESGTHNVVQPNSQIPYSLVKPICCILFVTLYIWMLMSHYFVYVLLKCHREAQKDLQGGLSLDSHLGLLQNLAQALRMFDS